MSAQAMEQEERFNLFRYLDNWWFGKGSPATLGLFRIIIAGLCFINLAMIAIDFDDWFSEKGFVPQEVAQRYAPNVTTLFEGSDFRWELPFAFPRLNLLGGVQDDLITAIFYALVMAAALLTTVGLWTRVSSIALAVGLITLHHRNLLILHGGDTVLRQFIIILALSPCGAACSLDRFMAVWKGKAPPSPPLISLWGQRLIQFQIVILYFTAVWFKRGSPWRWDGTATYYISQLREFDRFPLPEFLERQPFVGITTYATLITELSLATLVFYRPLRKWVLLAGIMMHGYIEYRFNIPLFAFITCSGYLCFYEGHEVATWAKRLGQRVKRFSLKVWLPVGHVLKPGRGDAIRNADPLGLVDYLEGDNPEWRAETASGRPRNPFRATWQRSLGAWPISVIPGLWRKLVLAAAVPIAAQPATTTPQQVTEEVSKPVQMAEHTQHGGRRNKKGRRR